MSTAVGMVAGGGPSPPYGTARILRAGEEGVNGGGLTR